MIKLQSYNKFSIIYVSKGKFSKSYSQQATEKLANNFKKTAARVNKSSFLMSIIYLARNITTNGKRIRLRFISAISAVEDSYYIMVKEWFCTWFCKYS